VVDSVASTPILLFDTRTLTQDEIRTPVSLNPTITLPLIKGVSHVNTRIPYN